MPRHGGRSIAAQGVEQQAIQKTQSNQNGDHDLGWNVHVVETVNVDQIKRKVAQHHGKGDQSNFLEVPVTRVTEDINACGAHDERQSVHQHWPHRAGAARKIKRLKSFFSQEIKQQQ